MCTNPWIQCSALRFMSQFIAMFVWFVDRVHNMSEWVCMLFVVFFFTFRIWLSYVFFFYIQPKYFREIGLPIICIYVLRYVVFLCTGPTYAKHPINLHKTQHKQILTNRTLYNRTNSISDPNATPKMNGSKRKRTVLKICAAKFVASWNVHVQLHFFLR